ncbi:hypothetical protein L1080_004280 [Rhodococcus sp. MSC1_016]|jgi:hypothetical protein|uniref:hypothetical protein n=1 Tax=Rhodococcus sp. MSC1_016 TaxID=2909266 RepID=UPI00203064B7|nr:hypothetical protein [Rhodococcus sp. MSC1_016]
MKLRKRNWWAVSGAVAVVGVAVFTAGAVAANASREESDYVSTYTPTPAAPAPVSVTEENGTVRTWLGTEQVRLDRPLVGDAKAVALYFHGQGGNVDDRMGSPWLNTLREAGWSVASGDLNLVSWGNPQSVNAAANLQKWAEETAGAPVKLIVAGSMGAAVSLNALGAGAVSAPCWYGFQPVVDLNSVGNVPGQAAQITAAYGASIPDTSNPITGAAKLPDIDYHVLASPGDTQVPKAANGDRLANIVPDPKRLTQAAATGEHGDQSHFNPIDLGTFARGCVGKLVTGPPSALRR